jgi:hypothetical protein
MVITGVDFEFSGHDVVLTKGFVDLQTNLLNGQVAKCVEKLSFFASFVWLPFSHGLSFSIDVIPFLIFFVLSKLVMSSRITMLQRARRLMHWFCGLQPLSAEEQSKLVVSITRT